MDRHTDPSMHSIFKRESLRVRRRRLRLLETIEETTPFADALLDTMMPPVA